MGWWAYAKRDLPILHHFPSSKPKRHVQKQFPETLEHIVKNIVGMLIYCRHVVAERVVAAVVLVVIFIVVVLVGVVGVAVAVVVLPLSLSSLPLLLSLLFLFLSSHN